MGGPKLSRAQAEVIEAMEAGQRLFVNRMGARIEVASLIGGGPYISVRMSTVNSLLASGHIREGLVAQAGSDFSPATDIQYKVVPNDIHKLKKDAG